MNRLFVFGDSFGHHQPFQLTHKKNFVTYYNTITKKFKALFGSTEYYNFSKNGTGPEYSMQRFHEAMKEFDWDRGDYIIILLSDPGRDVSMDFTNNRKRNQYGNNKGVYYFENIRNLIYLNYISEHFFPEVKIFCSIIWNETTFCEGRLINNNSKRFDNVEMPSPNKNFTSKEFLKLNDVKNFYYCDCELGIIHMLEFYKLYNIHFNDNEDPPVIHLTQKTNEKFEIDTINDFRINHMSQKTHDTFAKLILDFFLHGEKPVNTEDMFEKGFLMAGDPFIETRKEFIYE